MPVAYRKTGMYILMLAAFILAGCVTSNHSIEHTIEVIKYENPQEIRNLFEPTISISIGPIGLTVDEESDYGGYTNEEGELYNIVFRDGFTDKVLPGAVSFRKAFTERQISVIQKEDNDVQIVAAPEGAFDITTTEAHQVIYTNRIFLKCDETECKIRTFSINPIIK